MPPVAEGNLKNVLVFCASSESCRPEYHAAAARLGRALARADRVVVYHGRPGIEATASCPQSLLTGMNVFLKSLEVTFRRDPVNFRPRINKRGSQKDAEQKKGGPRKPRRSRSTSRAETSCSPARATPSSGSSPAASHAAGSMPEANGSGATSPAMCTAMATP